MRRINAFASARANIDARKESHAKETFFSSSLFSLIGILLISMISQATPTEATVGLVNGNKYVIMNYVSKKVIYSQPSAAYPLLKDTRAHLPASEIEWTYLTSGTGQDSFALTTSSGSYMRIEMNSSGTTQVNLSSATDFYSQLTVTRVSSPSGLYRITVSVSGTTYYLRDVSGSYMSFSTTLDSYCYWSITPVTKKSADIYSHYYRDESYLEGLWHSLDDPSHSIYFDTHQNDSRFVQMMNSHGYTAASHCNSTAANAYTQLKKDSVFIFGGHAGPGKIQFNQALNVTNGFLAVSTAVVPSATDNRYLSGISSNGLANARCVIYLGCKAGSTTSSGSYNLVTKTYSLGAHYVVGATKSLVTNGETNRFIDEFLDQTSANQNLLEAVYYACLAASGDSSFTVKALGDGYQYLW